MIRLERSRDETIDSLPPSTQGWVIIILSFLSWSINIRRCMRRISRRIFLPSSTRPAVSLSVSIASSRFSTDSSKNSRSFKVTSKRRTPCNDLSQWTIRVWAVFPSLSLYVCDVYVYVCICVCVCVCFITYACVRASTHRNVNSSLLLWMDKDNYV